MHFSIKTDQPVRSYAHLKRESLRIALHRSAILQELLHRTSYPLPSSQLIFTSIWLHNGIREIIGVKIMHFSIKMDHQPVRSYAHLKRESLRIALHRSAILQELLHRTSYPLPSSQFIFTSIWLHDGIREIIGVKIMHFSIKTDKPVRSYAHSKRESLRIALHRSAILQELLHRTSYPLPSSQ